MPSERRRQKTKEDTWGTEELSKSIKDAMRDDSAQKKRSHDKEKRRDGERTKDREHRKDKEHRDRDKDKEKRRREKHRSEDVDNKDGHRDKTRDRDKEDKHKEDKDRRHRNEDEREKKRGESSRDKDRTRDDKERRHKEKSQDKERKHRENGERNSAQTKTKKEDTEMTKKEDIEMIKIKTGTGKEDTEMTKKKRHRDDKDKDRERRHRDDKERSHDKEGDREKRHKEDKERRSDKDKERRHRDDKERHKNKDKRDSEDRDKHRDRNKREEENGEEERQNHRTRRDSKYDEDTGESVRHRSEDQSRSEEKEEDVEDEIQQGNEENGDDEYGYEDDFEDYDDDFEDDDEDEESEDKDKDEEDSVATRQTSAELDAIRRAMASENQAMHSGRKSKDTNSSGNSSRATTAKSSRSFINFVAAKQRQINSQVTEHSRKRGKDLMSLIELDVVGFDMFDMAPVREYELYIKSFGRSNTKQAFVQYNEDNLDRDVQTDPIENREIWTQHPAEGVSAFGGAGEKSDEDEVVNEADSLRLSKFLQKAGQAINILLEEDASDNAKGTLQSNQRSIIFSDGYSQLNSQLSFLNERHVVHAQFHPIQTNLLLTVHSTPNKVMSDGVKEGGVDGANSLSNKGLLCVWNVNEPFRPQKILSCKSTPTCCVFSPTKSTLAFAGTVDGSIVVWDLREPSSMHMSQEYDGQEWSIRVPTFSTDGIQDTHHSSVVTMQPIVAAEESLKASMQSTHTNGITDGLSFQLASLEEQGFIHFSVVIEIDKPDLAGSESDLGLVPSGKIKLIKTSSVSLTTNPSRGLGDVMKAFHMQLSPLDPNQFFVATDSGHIIHGARHGGKVPPRLYRDQLDLPVDIVQIDFSPFGLPVFLIACGDGSIRLHNITTDLPAITWNNSTNGISIKNLQWSRSRPSVFFVMDEASKVYVWELLENDGAPVKTEQFTHASLTFLTLSSDHPGSGRGQPNRRQEMLITDAKGAMDVHRINKTFSRSRENELNDMAQLLNNIT
ncbi:LOW QUALITY PROTEIN: cytoplasmic dynein 2 intermediate chain 1-like [Amphiura filiformis]|uniref:LOW QUALITY PROTEIN: cytoplasmic dynein 2 intermediate chain 1-like n=1 Tax=Amphiura filiformis TaxID=82378 RepID=UPI003B2205B6